MPMDFPSAALSAPPIQYPDLLGSYLRGRMAPSALQEQQNTLSQQGLNLDQLRMTLANQQMFRSAIQNSGLLGPQPGSAGGAPAAAAGTAGAGAQSGASSSGGIQTGPQGSVSAQPPSYDPSTNPLAPLLDPRRIAQMTQLGQLSALMSGKDANEPVAAALKLEQSAADYSKSQRQLQAQGPLDFFDSVFNSAAPARTVMANPSLISQWPAFAARLNIDPVSGFNDQNVRAALALAANTLRGNVGLPAKDYPVPLQTTQQGLGQSYQTDPVTGKISGGASAVPTDKYIINGRVVELPKAQGVGQGITPYDPALYGASLITPTTNEQAYQTAKASGSMPALAGRDPIAFAQESNYISARAEQEGITGLAMAARQQAFQAQQKVVNDFRDPNGKAGGQLININTSVQHTSALIPLIDAMASGDNAKINAARQTFETEWKGQPAPTNYQTLANIAVGEINKAVTANGGDANERAMLTAPFQSSLSPDVLRGAVQTATTALAGKTEALRLAWDNGTQGTQGPFDKMLLPATKRALGLPTGDSGAGNLPMTNAQGWQLHQDKAGNMAYVSPDGKQFERAR
jgi:hypothetical protein